MFDSQAEQYHDLHQFNLLSEEPEYRNSAESLLSAMVLKKTILIVGGDISMLLETGNALTETYYTMMATSAAEMFERLKTRLPAMILLDTELPGMDAFETLWQLKTHDFFSDIPVILLTGSDKVDEEICGFELDVVDCVKKPFSIPALRTRIARHLGFNILMHEQISQLRKLQTGILSVLGDLLEQRDKITGGHTERTARYVCILIDALMARKIYPHEIGSWDTEMVIASSRLHDVGKIVISDAILNKPGKLTPEEFVVMQTHAAEGKRIIEEMIAHTGEEKFLNSAKLFAGYHHERWNGGGYPYGLMGTDIPLHGRIMALSDVYDAMVSVRPYKKALDHESAVRFIMDGAGTLFDPELVGVFGEVHHMFKIVATRRAFDCASSQ